VRAAALPCLALGLAVSLLLCAAAPASRSADGLHVVASGLDNPRKLFVDAAGRIYVVEAGHGGRDRCIGRGSARTCIGLSGAITQFVPGGKRRVVTGLWSGAMPDGNRAQGPADVLVRGKSYYVLLQNGSITPQGTNYLGPDGATAGDLVTTPGGKAAPAIVVNFAAFEAAKNPDRGAGPGARLGSPPIDSNPYAFVPYRGGFAVVDAGGNDLLWVSPRGEVSVLAVFPVRRTRLSKALAAQIGKPSLRWLAVQSVPSSVAVGPDGALYVGELTGWPFVRGNARVWRVVPGKGKTVYASGFTNISDLAFDGKRLLVLELAANGLLDPRSPGRLVAVAPGGARTVLAQRALVAPTGLAVARDGIYVANHGLSRATGPGPHGEVVRVKR
jgi:hypothetical protein